MKKLICIGLILCVLLSTTACGLFDQIKNQANNIGGNFTSDIFEMLADGVDSIQTILGQNMVEAAGEMTTEESGKLHIYANKLVITAPTNAVYEKAEAEGVTIEKLKSEQEDAKTAQMDYTLEYQFCLQFKVNGETKTAVGVATVTESSLTHTLNIEIPVDAEQMGVTIYDLLQGGQMVLETRLQHGTANTKICTETYFANKLPEGKTGNILTIVDHRNAK